MTVTFVSIDTVSIDEDKHSPQVLLDQLDYELGRDESDWKIVFAHYPCYSAGNHPGYDSTRKKVLPIMEKHNVDMYLAGHDHDLQHWVKEHGAGMGKLDVSKTVLLYLQYVLVISVFYRSLGNWGWWQRAL